MPRRAPFPPSAQRERVLTSCGTNSIVGPTVQAKAFMAAVISVLRFVTHLSLWSTEEGGVVKKAPYCNIRTVKLSVKLFDVVWR